MTRVTWYFDFISPFAYLQHTTFDLLPQDLEIEYKPILFAGLLNHWSHRGPAEIPRKRELTYRHVQWLADRAGVPMRFPPGHPFNPIKALRLAIAAGLNQKNIHTIFAAIWAEGRDLTDESEIEALGRSLGLEQPLGAISQPAVKQTLKDNGAQAVAQGLFGVPTFLVGDELFWGNDTTQMMLDYLAHPEHFQTNEMKRLRSLPQSVSRI